MKPTPANREGIIDLVSEYAPTNSICFCFLCCGTSPIFDRFIPSYDSHGATFTCKECGEEVRFGEHATPAAIELGLYQHRCEERV